ncbi:MAG: hypothetical protein M1834_001755 [Cirrosporium novae-zelandiae]|nr:MAG: hypothetical protein M1834_001755 [Cirrosporium novae-zelandiae]
MLRSTHRPAPAPPPLPPGWTEHKAPTGHSYYYNATTKQSTYTRPAPLPPQPAPATNPYPGSSFIPPNPNFNIGPQGQINPSDFQSFTSSRGRGDFRGGRSYQDRRKREPEDRPKSKHPIPNCEPWLLVKTKLGRRFVHNPETNESFWKFPQDVLKGVVEYDRIERERKERREKGEDSEPEFDEAAAVAELNAKEEGEKSTMPFRQSQPLGDSDEYEEVEVTDDEEEDTNPTKRQRTEEPLDNQPVEFNEDDIAYQLAAMGQDYGLDPGEYDTGEYQDLEEGAEGLPLTDEDSHALFKDLLDDFNFSPYSTWEHIVEDGRIIEDDRYTILSTMKERKHVFSEWCRERVRILKEQREKEAKKDPRIPYLAFLQDHATPKLYWPEFRRKFKKDQMMRDSHLGDKDREKLYRDHISRLKMPESTRKSDLSTLLKSVPLKELNSSTSLHSLPSSILSDLRYISLPSKTRDQLIETYISTLTPAPENSSIMSPEDEEAAAKKKSEREKREKALRERERRVQEDKRKHLEMLRDSKRELRQGEREIEEAMRVNRGGLKAYMEVDESSEAASKGV